MKVSHAEWGAGLVLNQDIRYQICLIQSCDQVRFLPQEATAFSLFYDKKCA